MKHKLETLLKSSLLRQILFFKRTDLYVLCEHLTFRGNESSLIPLELLKQKHDLHPGGAEKIVSLSVDLL